MELMPVRCMTCGRVLSAPNRNVGARQLPLWLDEHHLKDCCRMHIMCSLTKIWGALPVKRRLTAAIKRL